MSSQSPTNLYYDLDIVNTLNPANSVAQAQGLNRLTFTEVRSSPILMNPSDYFLSIVRFSLDTPNSMPLVLPQIDLTQSNDIEFPNKTVYYVTLSFDDGTNPILFQKKQVIFVPQSTGIINRAIPVPPTFPLDLVKATSQYFWLSSFQWFINMINQALSDCYDDLFNIISLAPYTLPADLTATSKPYMEWDNENNKATLIFPYTTPFSYAQDPLGIGNAKVLLYLNSPLFTLFSSFENIFNGSYLDVNLVGIQGIEANYIIQNYVKYGNINLVGTAPTQTTEMIQPYATGAIICPIQSLIFNTSLMPIVPQLVGIPRIFRDNNSSTGQNDNISNEITDLVVNLNRGDEYFPTVLYLPTAEYRLIDLQGNAPISGIQISVQWKDIYGIYHDFFLANSCNCSMKILFRLKEAGVS
jgi:hypothetical protein